MRPVDYLVVEFPAGKSNFSGEMAAELASLVKSGTIRVLDLLILHKADDGTVEAFEIDDLDEDQAGELLGLETEIAEILAAEDVVHLAEAMVGGPPRRWPADRHRQDSHPGDRGVHRGRRRRAE